MAHLEATSEDDSSISNFCRLYEGAQRAVDLFLCYCLQVRR